MMSKMLFPSKNVNYRGFHFDGILGVLRAMGAIFDDIITKVNFICINTGIDILKIKIGKI